MEDHIREINGNGKKHNKKWTNKPTFPSTSEAQLWSINSPLDHRTHLVLCSLSPPLTPIIFLHYAGRWRLLNPGETNSFL